MKTTLSSGQIKQWNRQGFIPGLNETEEDYIKRVEFCLNLEEELIKQIGQELPFSLTDKASQDILTAPSQQTAQLYDICPSWVLLFFNNYQLTPWQGGCAWIFQLTEETPMTAFLQLRAIFRKQKSYWGLYQRDELIAHELAHVGRMMYQEPQFEEILAYQTAHSRWRRWLGPIVQSSNESLLFILVLGVIIMADLALFAFNQEHTYFIAMWLKWIPFILVGGALGRLIWRQRIFNNCLQRLKEIYKNPDKALPVIYRLSDQEIRFFASSSVNTLSIFMQNQQDMSFRWKFLMQNYPLPID